ncbi:MULTISPECIES: glycosyltransferase [Dermabacter]|nr:MULTISPECIES: glycosyltransferase [Dermabacter]
MLFISPSVRELVRAEAPRLNQAKRIQTVRNPHNYEQFSPEKVEGFEKTLLQVGWSVSVKDPFFTFDVLEALRHEDPQWRLLLVGPEPPLDPESREIAFISALQERLAALGSAVEVLGKRDDVPAVMHRAGFIISSSRHEGTHESIAEGAAAGCIPVVRNWPDAARWGGGARSIYPDEWVVESVAEAVARIRSTLRPSVREVHVRECIDWVAQNRRSADVLPPYLDAIHGR